MEQANAATVRDDPPDFRPRDGAARALRAATAAEHAAVEALPLMAGLMSPRLDARLYAEVLRRQLRAHAGWEQACAAWLQGLAPRWRYRPRAPALRADLHALGMSPAPAAAAPAPDDEAQAWGMLYVVEGSALGGRLIARHVRATCPALAVALSHFQATAPAGGGWPEFRHALEAALAGTAARQRGVVGARAMFQHFHACLATPCAEAA